MSESLEQTPVKECTAVGGAACSATPSPTKSPAAKKLNLRANSGDETIPYFTSTPQRQCCSFSSDIIAPHLSDVSEEEDGRYYVFLTGYFWDNYVVNYIMQILMSLQRRRTCMQICRRILRFTVEKSFGRNKTFCHCCWIWSQWMMKRFLAVALTVHKCWDYWSSVCLGMHRNSSVLSWERRLEFPCAPEWSEPQRPVVWYVVWRIITVKSELCVCEISSPSD